jgi:signal transduction histidine kinase
MTSIAHEVINPLSAALNLSMLVRQLLRIEPLPPARIGEMQKYLDDVVGEVSRVCRLLSDVRTFSQSSETPAEPSDLNRLVMGILTLISHRLKLENVALETSLADGLPWIRCKPSQIQQLVLSLVLSSVGAVRNRQGAAVSVTTGVLGDGEAVFAEVRSNGDGGAGAGLALDVAQLIAQAHGGHIEVESRPGSWTAARLILPVRE